MNFPDKEALIDLALNGLEADLAYLCQRLPEMTSDQRRAFIMICARIAGMEEQEAA